MAKQKTWRSFVDGNSTDPMEWHRATPGDGACGLCGCPAKAGDFSLGKKPHHDDPGNNGWIVNYAVNFGKDIAKTFIQREEAVPPPPPTKQTESTKPRQTPAETKPISPGGSISQSSYFNLK